MTENKKRCTKCGKKTPTTEYSQKIGCKNDLDSRCKICIRKYRNDWGKKNRKKLNKTIKLWRSKNKKYLYEKGKEWTENNREKCREAGRKWYAANKDKHSDARKLWCKKHPKECKAKYQKEYRKKMSTQKGALDKRMGCVIWQSLRGNKKGRHWETLVGFSVEELRTHLEKQFTDGMSWKNFGEWHIDHVIAKSRFNYEHPEEQEFRICWGLANLQPMWGKDNLSKHTKTMDEWNRIKNGKQ